MDSGRFLLGPELAGFESELGKYLGINYVLGVNSGTDALILSLKALGLGPNDEVITTPFTFFATVEAIVQAGAKPILADIEPDTLCLSLSACETAITEHTKAILLVHVFGNCTDIERFVKLCQKHNLFLIEDTCQAIGSTWKGKKLGTFGHISTFSFYPTKNLAALGDAGAIATTDPDIADRIKLLRNHGINPQGRHTLWGYKSLLDEIQAAFLKTKLKRLDIENARRRKLAGRYDNAFENIVQIVQGQKGCKSTYHQYAILTPKRNELCSFLAENGVETGRYYENPIHREPVFAGTNLRLPVAEKASQAILTLPIRPSLTDSEQERVISLIRGFFEHHD